MSGDRYRTCTAARDDMVHVNVRDTADGTDVTFTLTAQRARDHVDALKDALAVLDAKRDREAKEAAAAVEEMAQALCDAMPGDKWWSLGTHRQAQWRYVARAAIARGAK